MSMLIFGLASEKKIIIDEEKMIKTSFPNFKEILNSMEQKIEFISKINIQLLQLMVRLPLEREP